MIQLSSIADRLTPLSVTVLLPEQLDLPLAGGRGGAERGGLGKYLSEHAGHYVQLYDLTPTFTAQGVYDTYLLTVDVIGSDRAGATELAGQCRSLLSSTPRKGRNITTFMPERVEILPGDAYRVTVQFEVREARTQE